jgi:hypothetical protein
MNVNSQKTTPNKNKNLTTKKTRMMTNGRLAIISMLSIVVLTFAVRSPDTDSIPTKGAPTDITGLTMEEIVGNIHRE